MTMASRLSQEEENYIKMGLLLVRISPRAARTLFDREFAPSCLGSSLQKEYNKLIDLRNERVINQSQWNLLFPRFPNVPDSKTFDVMLMITLIRHLTNLNPPHGGFDQLPSANETTPTSDLARITYYRNVLFHLEGGKVDSTTFTIAWDNVTDAISRLGGQQMKQECDDLKVRKLEQTNHLNDKIMELDMPLRSMKKANDDILAKIENLKVSSKITVPNKDIKGIGETDLGIGETDLGIEESDSDESMDCFTCGNCKRNFTLLTDFMKHKETCDQVEAFTGEGKAITPIYKAYRAFIQRSSLSRNTEGSYTESSTDSSGYSTDDRSSSRVRRLPKARGNSMNKGKSMSIGFPIPPRGRTDRSLSRCSSAGPVQSLLQGISQGQVGPQVYIVPTDLNNIPSGCVILNPRTVPLLMSSFLCDGHAIDCIIDRRLVEYYSKPRITTKDFLKLKEDIEKGQKNAFQNLIMVSTFFKERKQCSISMSRELLILSVKTKQDLLCRLLLSYITDRANQLPDLLEVLSIVMGEEQNHSANAIAWLITKTFFLAYKVLLLDCILDVWPAFKCKCKGKYEKRVCSSHVVIVVELESEINNERIPDEYFSVEVVFLTNGISNEKNTKTELQDSVADIHFADDKPITGLSARNLFAKHRKLTLISKSSFHKHGIEKQCVNLFCRVKGLIPIGENHLPRLFCSLPTKIQQGRPQLMTNIRVGDKIGTDDFKKGTLGGFLKVRGDRVFLTCLHILLSTEDLASENITLNDEQPLSIKCYSAGESSTASNTTSYVCGKIRDIAFKTDNCESTSIDAALIKVKKGIEICPTDYAVTGNENTVNHGQIGLHSPFLNNCCVDFRKFCYTHPKPTVTTVSVGAISGMNEVGSEIMENRAFGTDLEPFYQSFDNVFLDGMKHIATCVIESIRRSRNPFIPLSKQILDTVEDQGKGHFPTETIKNIAKIVYEVYTKTGSNGQGDAQLEVNELLHKATFDNTSSSFSAIVGDVHLQSTFLKWTVDRETSKRTSRKMYGQIHISNIPFKPGDSGSCIYVTHPEKGCIGLAIANHPNGGCIATPIMEILKHFNIRNSPNQ